MIIANTLKMVGLDGLNFIQGKCAYVANPGLWKGRLRLTAGLAICWSITKYYSMLIICDTCVFHIGI